MEEVPQLGALQHLAHEVSFEPSSNIKESSLGRILRQSKLPEKEFLI
jgi:hypothetical protein